MVAVQVSNNNNKNNNNKNKDGEKHLRKILMEEGYVGLLVLMLITVV